MQQLKLSTKINTLFTITLLIISQNIVAQDLNELSKQDTIYYYFKHKKNETVRGLKVYTPPNLMNMVYTVRFKKIHQHFSFIYYKQRKRSNGLIIDNPPLVKSKRFLKKNKDKLLTYCKLKKFDLKSIKDFYWKNRRKHIYIIDKEDTKGGKIYLKKVNWSSSFPIEQ